MVQFISSERARSVRWPVLRTEKPFETTAFEGDSADGTFHLGYIIDQEVVSVASFMINSVPDDIRCQANLAYQLRGMATLEAYQGQGFGAQICHQSFKILNCLGCELLWANARIAAISFYERLGFEASLKTFIIEGVGPHRRIHARLN